MIVALLPLDERPVNTRYPQMIGAIAGAEVRLPPARMLPVLRQSGDRVALAAWLRAQAAEAEALVVSLDMLAYGGLIASRITDDPLTEVLAALEVLAQIKRDDPALHLTVFNVITRIPDADNNIEEPHYWGTYGRRLHRYSQRMHRRQAGEDVQVPTDDIPADYIADFTQRRLRNHIVNLALVRAAARGAVDVAVISSDDTSVYGYGSQEKAWLATWVDRLNLPADRLLMYPGADEVGAVLLLRALLRGADAPRFAVHYAIDEDRDRIAPYEDSPIATTVARQIQALGGDTTHTPDDADFIVAVNTPSAIGQEYDAEQAYFEAERARRAPALAAFAADIARWLAADRRVIVCDVAYPNGSDPDLVHALRSRCDLRQLAAYGAWNTAGNTIGVALAQGVAAARATTPARQHVQQRFLLHRFLEDWGYQHLTRAQVRAWLHATTGHPDTTPENEAATLARIQRDLAALLPQLSPLSDGWLLGDVRLPWHRTFEVDFDLLAWEDV